MKLPSILLKTLSHSGTPMVTMRKLRARGVVLLAHLTSPASGGRACSNPSRTPHYLPPKNVAVGGRCGEHTEGGMCGLSGGLGSCDVSLPPNLLGNLE